MALGMTLFCSSIFRCLIPGSFSHTRLDRVSGSPIVVGDDIGVAILDILFGYADVVIGNVHFRNLNSLVYNLPILSKSLQCLNGLFNAAGQVMLLEWLLK